MLTKFIKELLVLLVLAALTYFNLLWWQSPFWGALFLIGYLYVTAGFARIGLAKFFHLSERAFRLRILGAFFSLTTLSFVAGLFLVFYKLNLPAIALSFFLNGLIYLFLGLWAGTARNNPPEIENADWEVLEEMPNAKLALLVYLILAGYGFYLLSQAHSASALASPWQVIDPAYIWVFFAATAILGLLLFSKLKAKTLLFLLIIHSLLLHAYLPLTQELLYGADGWRHIGAESGLAAGQILTNPAAQTGAVTLINRLNVGELSYGWFWAANIILSKILGVSFLTLTRWFLPIMFSLVFPIILFEIGKALGWNKKAALAFVWVSFLPFALQVAGAFSLPANWGFLFWSALLLLLLRRLQNRRAEQAAVLALLGILAFCGYLLYGILFFLCWGTAEIYLHWHRFGRPKFYNSVIIIFTSVLTIVCLPVLELASGYGKIDSNFNLPLAVRQFVGNISGYFLATGPRPHDIAAGNILFNQTPGYAFVPNWFTAHLWWLPLVGLAFLALSFFGLYRLRETVAGKWAAGLFMALFAGYFIGRYALAGEQILTRRLDAVLALGWLIFIFSAVVYFYRKFTARSRQRYFGMVAAALILLTAAVTAASYSLGPDARAVGVDEYAAAQWIWRKESGSQKRCVLSDTYPLVALEAVSARKIVGGGFPIGELFAQPERVALYEGLITTGDAALWRKAKNVTGAEHCYLLAPREANSVASLKAKKSVQFNSVVIFED